MWRSKACDGPQVMVTGSEPTGEYRVQYFVPAYLSSGLPRPVITNTPTVLSYNALFSVDFTLTGDTISRCAQLGPFAPSRARLRTRSAA